MQLALQRSMTDLSGGSSSSSSSSKPVALDPSVLCKEAALLRELAVLPPLPVPMLQLTKTLNS